MTASSEKSPSLPPRWFVRIAWLGAAPEPARWLNLQARPEASVALKTGTRRVRGRAATGEERDRLWAMWRATDKGLDGFASRRPAQTAVVVLEPADQG